jgi:NADPH-dependent 7-cyano-7-deazaguanine reductase QueF-like protein
MNTPEQSQLGKSSAYIDQYDPSLLFPLPRAPKREEIGLQGSQMPFFGADLWTAFELSWLNPRGKPQVALAHFTIPCETPNLIESKSFKLYLNSFNNTRLADAAEVQSRLRTDLAEALWRGSDQKGSIGVKIIGLDRFDQEGLLQYLVSFRNHNEFHEQCVERIFMDIWTRCRPIKLSVYARYTRRGGLDINPFRTSHPGALPGNVRSARQ